MLLALEDEFGGGQRVGQLARFLRDPEHIDGGEGDSREYGEPHAGDIDARNFELCTRDPWQRQVKEDQQAGSCENEDRQHSSQANGQRRRGNDHRYCQQQGKRVHQAAGHVEQASQLQAVEQQDAERGLGPSRCAAG